METISFALGVASILVVLLGAVTVWVTLKVKNLTIENQSLIYTINSVEQQISRRLENMENHFTNETREIISTSHNRIDDVLRTNQNGVNDLQQQIYTFYSECDRKIQDCISYTDSRIDKLVNNPKFGVVKEKSLLTD